MSVSPRRRSLATETQLASTIAGISSRIILHPVDCVKTRLQHIRGRPELINANDAIWKFVMKEGFPGLYRGIIGALIGVIPYSMIYMPSYEFAQSQLSTRMGNSHVGGVRHIMAGSFAGFCGSLVKVPVDVVKKRLQAGLYPHIGVALHSIAAEGKGGSQFYAGWRSSIAYDIPYNAVQFSVLENVKKVAKCIKGGRELKGLDNVFVGAITGMITSVMTEPLDVIKTRLMTQHGNAQNTLYRGWFDCMRTIIREEGTRALWKGTLPRLVWVGASSAIWYGTYQAAREAMARRSKESNGKLLSNSLSLDSSHCQYQ